MIRIDLTPQEAFDKVCLHLDAQGHQSTKNGCCAYRGFNGDKCAIGCLIPDENYVSSIEGNVLENLIDDGIIITPLSIDFLDGLQMAHDRHLWCDIKFELLNVAERHRLNTDLCHSLAFSPE